LSCLAINEYRNLLLWVSQVRVVWNFDEDLSYDLLMFLVPLLGVEVHFNGISEVGIRNNVPIHQHEVIINLNLRLTNFSQSLAQRVGSFKFEVANF
jgi:hypothetical protein